MIACVRECVGRAGSRSVSSIRERGADDCAGACGVPYFVGEFRLSTRTELLFLSRSIQRPRRFSEFVCIYRQGGRGARTKSRSKCFRINTVRQRRSRLRTAPGECSWERSKFPRVRHDVCYGRFWLTRVNR